MVHRIRFLVLVIAVLVASVVGFAEELATMGHLVLNGGGGKPAVVMEKFIELAGGVSATVVVFPTASELTDTGDYYRDLFVEEYGCEDVRVADVSHRTDARDPQLAEMVSAAGGIWFAGGDQRRIVAALLDTPVGNAVIEACRNGAVVGGTSAGTACQSGLMLTGDGDFEVITADNVELWDGFGLLPLAIIDQHFVARQRQNRLMSVVLEHPQLLGIGVDEATAVWVRPDRTFEVLGDGWVMVFDAVSAEVTRSLAADGNTHLGVHGMVTHILQPGEMFDLEERRIVVPDPVE